MCKEVNVVMDFPLVKVEVVLILGQNDNFTIIISMSIIIIMIVQW